MKVIRYGFEIDGKMYGWNEKNLYSINHMRKLKLQPVGNKFGYSVGNYRKKSIEQLEQITTLLSVPIIKNEIKDKSCPF